MRIIWLSILAFYSLGFSACTASKEREDTLFNIMDFGAIGDSTTLNTEAFQKALDKAHAAGGKVIVPKGNFLTGTIYLKSNTILELMPSARILGSAKLLDYDSLYWGHNEDRTPYHLIVAKNAENVTIQGLGTIDGHEISNISLRHIQLKYPYIENPELYGPEANSNQFLGIDSVGMKAKATIVVSNVDQFPLVGLNIIWNQTDTISEEWKHPERIENGKFGKVHYPIYDRVKMAEFNALYTHKVQNG